MSSCCCLIETRPSIRLSQSFVQSSDLVGRRKVTERCESVGTDEGIYFYSFPSKLCRFLFIFFQGWTQTAALLFQPSFFLTFGRDLLETAGEAHLRTCSTRYCCQLALRRICSFCPFAPFHPDSRDSPRLFLFCFVLRRLFRTCSFWECHFASILSSLRPKLAVFDTEIRSHLGRNQSASAESVLCFTCRNPSFLCLRNYSAIFDSKELEIQRAHQ